MIECQSGKPGSQSNEVSIIYIEIEGKLVPFDKLPCAKCEWRYSIHCPHCEWNKDGKYNTYGGIVK